MDVYWHQSRWWTLSVTGFILFLTGWRTLENEIYFWPTFMGLSYINSFSTAVPQKGQKFVKSGHLIQAGRGLWANGRRLVQILPRTNDMADGVFVWEPQWGREARWWAQTVNGGAENDNMLPGYALENSLPKKPAQIFHSNGGKSLVTWLSLSLCRAARSDSCATTSHLHLRYHDRNLNDVPLWAWGNILHRPTMFWSWM